MSTSHRLWYHAKIMEDENKDTSPETIAPKTDYVSKKEEKTVRQAGRERSKKWRSMLAWGIPLLVILGVVVWLFTLPRIPQSATVKGKNHIHANLTIMIDGERMTIPGGIGLLAGGGTTHIPGTQKVIHTHVENDQLHIEAVDGGPLHEDDTKLSTFFHIWGKEFTSTKMLDKTTLGGGTLQFKVNGKDNTEFENLQMHDGDRLEIIYTNATGTAPTVATSSKPH